jgi:hypothetical protein
MKVRSTGSLPDKKPAEKCCVLSEGKLDKIRARLEKTLQKSLRHLEQEISISKSSAAKAAKLLKLWSYKVTVVQALQPRDSASRINFCNWFLQTVHEGEVDPHLTSFSEEAWFHFHGHVSSQNNWYWSSVNQH